MPLINSKCYDGNILKYYSTKSFLCAYYRSILDGTNIVGKRMKQVVEKCMLETMDDKWKYNTEIEFKKRLLFMMKFICHSKSPWYSKPFIPCDYFCAWLEVLYAFRRAENPKKLRRFKKTLFYIARKNAKTFSASAVLSSEFMSQAGVDLIAFSNSYNQSKMTYDQVDACRNIYDENDEFTRRRIDGIYNIKNHSTIKMVSGNSKCVDGYNCDIVVADELHEMNEKGRLAYNALYQSQSLKDNPLLIMLTTDGFYEEGSFLDVELKNSYDILDGKMVGSFADSYLPWLYEQDSIEEVWDVENKQNWQKSNPSLGTIKKFSFLEELVERAKTDSSVRATLLTKDFNIHAPQGIAWLGDYICNVKTDNYITREELERGIASGKYRLFCSGTDLSETYDMSSVCFLLPYLEDGNLKFDIYHRIYTSPQNVKDNAKFINEGLDLFKAVKDDLIEVSDNGLNAIDTRMLAREIFSLASKGLIPIGNYFDNRFCSEFINACYELNIETKMLNQSSRTLSPYINSLERYIIQNEIQVSPVVEWMVKNVRCKSNMYGDIIFNKKSKYAKIDGVDALVNAFACYTDNLTQIKRYLGVN